MQALTAYLYPLRRPHREDRDSCTTQDNEVFVEVFLNLCLKTLFLEVPIGEFHIRSKAIQKPGPGALLVRVYAAALNPVDWEDTRQSCTPRVTAKLPSNVSFDEVASVPLCLATAAVGSSSVGQYVVQLAKLSGFSTIVMTAPLHNTDLLKSLGAWHVIDRNADGPAAAKKILGDIPTEFIYGPELRLLGVSLYSKLTSLLWSGAIKVGMALLYKFRIYADIILSSIANIEVLPNGLSGILDGLDRLKKIKVSGTKLVARPLEPA
ncbi:hypothetical protein ACEPAG_6883 [Sanghuangporus baumii]